jgi:hypothetical protein
VSALALELQDAELMADCVDGVARVFLAALYRSERAIAGQLRLLSAGGPPWPVTDTARAISPGWRPRPG